MSPPTPMQTPPSSAPALRTRRSWPGVLGTISIILGSLGVLCWGCNTGSSVLAMVSPDTFVESTTYSVPSEPVSSDAESEATPIENEGDTGDPAAVGGEVVPAGGSPGKTTTTTTSFEMQGQATLPDIIVSLVSFVLSIWLLVGGIGLVSRKPWSVSSLKAWSLVRILVTITWVVLAFVTMDKQIELIQEQMRVQSAQGGEDLSLSMETLRLLMIIFVVITSLFFLAWPIFLLLFLGRDSVRSEVDSWRGSEAIIGRHPES